MPKPRRGTLQKPHSPSGIATSDELEPFSISFPPQRVSRNFGRPEPITREPQVSACTGASRAKRRVAGNVDGSTNDRLAFKASAGKPQEARNNKNNHTFEHALEARWKFRGWRAFERARTARIPVVTESWGRDARLSTAAVECVLQGISFRGRSTANTERNTGHGDAV